MNWCGYYGEYVSQMKVFVEHSSLGVVLLKKKRFFKIHNNQRPKLALRNGSSVIIVTQKRQ